MASELNSKKFRTSIAIGCTGMLSDALQWLSKQSEKTIVISRNSLSESPSSSNIIKIESDYTDSIRFMESLKNSIEPESVDLLLIWIHKSGNETLQKLLDVFVNKECLVFHVLSSSSSDPAAFKSALNERYGTRIKCTYKTIKLGAIYSNNSWRWLTDHEIASGAIEAMENVQDVTIGSIPI